LAGAPPALGHVQRLIGAGRLLEAGDAARTLVAAEPGLDAAWLLLAQLEQRHNRFDAMRAAAERAALLTPRSYPAQFLLVEALLLCGRTLDARERIATLEQLARQDSMVLSRLAELYTQAGAHEDALRCCRLAAELAPGESALLESLAGAETACGGIERAEALLTRAIGQSPRSFGAWYNRSVLRRQTPAANHVAELEAALAKIGPGGKGEVPLCFALAKELEDLGQHAQSFALLKRGADVRRRGMAYAVEDDEQAFATIAATFDAGLLARVGQVGDADSAPIFVMGLPRSGTTLVDRVLSSHPEVESLGEINDFTFTLLRIIGEPLGKEALVRRSATLDFTALGRGYLASVAGHGRRKRRFIDKTPWNFLYVGLIELSLPGAKIVHVRRHPLDSCYALYKTLFRAGSPYSYDLEDLARYYVAYDRLMRHWRELLPGRMLDVDYEALVDDLEVQARRMLAYCGLDWDPGCLEYHRNPSAAATASAAQVRQPLYKTSVGLWRHYERELAPLAARLAAAGIDVT